MAKLKIADVFIRTRTVEVPDECPKCKADLTQEGMLTAVKLDALYSTAKVTNDGVKIEFDADFVDFVYDIPVHSLICLWCGEGVVEGHDKRFESPEPEVFDDVVERTLWDEVIEKRLVNA